MRRFLAALLFRALFAGIIAAGMAAPLPVKAEPRDYKLDPEHLTVAFLVHHIGFAKTLGFFEEVEGSFTFDEESLSLAAVEVVVETDSVTTFHKKRDEHLRSKDFLNVKRFSEMTFVGTGAEKTGERQGRVTGDLTLLGQTRPLTLDVTWNKSGEYPFGGNPYVIGISARGTLRRSEFGMTYAVDNGWVGDEVELIIEFEARRQ